jgi:hypothetical protein
MPNFGSRASIGYHDDSLLIFALASAHLLTSPAKFAL